jgi:hypothetical protein
MPVADCWCDCYSEVTCPDCKAEDEEAEEGEMVKEKRDIGFISNITTVVNLGRFNLFTPSRGPDRQRCSNCRYVTPKENSYFCTIWNKMTRELKLYAHHECCINWKGRY